MKASTARTNRSGSRTHSEERSTWSVPFALSLSSSRTCQTDDSTQPKPIYDLDKRVSYKSGREKTGGWIVTKHLASGRYEIEKGGKVVSDVAETSLSPDRS